MHYIIAVNPRTNRYESESHSSDSILYEVRKRTEQHARLLGMELPYTTVFNDMDGVLAQGDAARICVAALDNDAQRGARVFDSISSCVIDYVRNGHCPFGYTLAAVAEHILPDKPVSLLEAIGDMIRLTPGAEEYIQSLQTDGKSVYVITTAYGPTAQRVGKRLGVPS